MKQQLYILKKIVYPGICLMLSFGVYPKTQMVLAQVIDHVPDATRSLMKLMDNRESIYNNPFDLIINEEATKADKTEGFTLMPDSVEEYVNLGYKKYNLKWYYHYNANYLLDTLYKYFYNEYWDPDEITEFETYDHAGRLLSRVRRQRNSWAIYHEGDSSFVDYLLVSNTWENDKLVKEVLGNILFIMDFIDTDTIYHLYDDAGKLIQDSSMLNEGSWSNTYYHYYPDGKLWYEYHKGDFSQVFYKYSYETTDTSRFTTQQRRYYYNPELQIDVDTITFWDYTDYFLESFNEEGRRISIMNSYLDDDGIEVIDYKAEYGYTDWGAIESARYYDWKSSASGGIWEEATRIDWQYNEDKKIEYYNNWFWDAKIEDWAPENRKIYYYSPVSNELGTEEKYLNPLEVFPNPAQDLIKLEYDEPEGYYLIFDLRGNLLKQGNYIRDQIPLSGLPAGMYFLQLRSNSQIRTARFMKL